MSKFSFLAFCILFSVKAIGQEQWSLTSCIDYAIKHNVALQQNQISVDQAAVILKESKYKRLPSLNGNLNGGISFGRNVDPTSNAFTTQDILYSNYSLTSSVVLFQGGFVRNSIKQNKLNKESTQLDYEQASNDLALNIAVYYLNVLQSQERLQVADKNREIAKLLLDQMYKLIKAGAKPEADAFELRSQLARADQSYVVAENTLDLAWLALKQGMRLEPETKMTIEPLREDQLNDLQIQNYTYQDLYNKASEIRPGIQAAKIRMESAKLGEKISHSLYYPTVFLSASIGSRFSDAAKKQVLSYSKDTLPGVSIDSKPALFEYYSPTYSLANTIPFKTQFDQFLGYGGGVSISIPIFDNYLAKGSVEKAKLNTKLSELQLELQKEKLSQDIYQAMTNFKAAIKEYDASQNVYAAAKSSFEKTQKRFEIGTANVFELNQIQSNYLNAETNLVIAKYDLVFKQKILDYYAGKQIKL